MKIRLFTLPNIITLMNLACGSVAAVYALMINDLKMAFYLIAAAAIFDFLDGFVARLTNSYSEIGKELDSLADVVSFGFAPSAILFNIFVYSGGHDIILGFSVFVVTVFSALRLARFNVDKTQSDEFVGMPVPACALFIAAIGYMFGEGMIDLSPYYAIGIALCLSWFLVSKIRMFALKFKTFAFKGNVLRYSFIVLSLVGVALLKIATIPIIAAIPLIIIAYVLVSMIRGMICAKCCRSEQ